MGQWLAALGREPVRVQYKVSKVESRWSEKGVMTGNKRNMTKNRPNTSENVANYGDLYWCTKSSRPFSH